MVAPASTQATASCDDLLGRDRHVGHLRARRHHAGERGVDDQRLVGSERVRDVRAGSLSGLHAAAMVPAAAGPYGMSGSGDIHVAGTGSFALEVAEYARDAGFTVAGLIELLDPARVGTEVHGLPVRAADDLRAGALAVVGAGGDRLAHWALLAPHGWRPATVVHPAAHVSPSARVAPGCVVAPAAPSSVRRASWASTCWSVAARSSATTPRSTPASSSTRAPTSPGTCGSGRARPWAWARLVADHLEVGGGGGDRGRSRGRAPVRRRRARAGRARAAVRGGRLVIGRLRRRAATRSIAASARSTPGALDRDRGGEPLASPSRPALDGAETGGADAGRGRPRPPPPAATRCAPTRATRRPWDEPDPLVTISIPTRNRPRLLVERSLASALAQTHEHLEVLVVGDAAGPEIAGRGRGVGRSARRASSTSRTSSSARTASTGSRPRR